MERIWSSENCVNSGHPAAVEGCPKRSGGSALHSGGAPAGRAGSADIFDREIRCERERPPA